MVYFIYIDIYLGVEIVPFYFILFPLRKVMDCHQKRDILTILYVKRRNGCLSKSRLRGKTIFSSFIICGL